MKTLRKYFVFLIIALGLSASCFAAQSQPCDNYYVQPNGIYLAPNGMYASIDGNLIQIHTLRSDEQGIFIPVNEIIAANLEWCPFCGRWYDPDYGHSDCSGFPED